MKKALASLALVVGVVAVLVFVNSGIHSDFPDLSKFENKFTCADADAIVKSKKVRVDLYLPHVNERAPYNEIVTVFTVADSGKQFAARNIIKGADANDLEKTQWSRKTYVRGQKVWQEVGDDKQFISDVVKSAPHEYLLDYRRFGVNKAYEPTSDDEAYINLLKNSGCSLHGPVG